MNADCLPAREVGSEAIYRYVEDVSENPGMKDLDRQRVKIVMVNGDDPRHKISFLDADYKDVYVYDAELVDA